MMNAVKCADEVEDRHLFWCHWESRMGQSRSVTRCWSVIRTLPNAHSTIVGHVVAGAGLTRNAAQPNGWANEIHPYFTGFTALANKFLTNLQAVP
jgi:hypothetical protein